MLNVWRWRPTWKAKIDGEKIEKKEKAATNLQKEFWKFFCSKTTRSSLRDTLVYNDKQFTSSEGKADAFNRFFASIFHPLDPYSDSSSPPDHSQNILESITVSTSDVNCLISSLPADKASGPDGISVRLLKECADEISPSLTALFNMSLSQGKVPQKWKEANVVPVFNKRRCP